MLDLNKLTEKELSQLIRESLKALKNKIPMNESFNVTGHYGRWLFAHKNNYQLSPRVNRDYDVIYQGHHYKVTSKVVKRVVGSHKIRITASTSNHYRVFILFGEDYEVLKAIKVFFHAHRQGILPVQLNMTIEINQQGEISIPGWYGNQDNMVMDDYLHIDYLVDITNSLKTSN